MWQGKVWRQEINPLPPGALILTVKGTHFYLVDCAGGKLLIDAGWELERFQAEMKAHQVSFHQIRWVMFTHHHPDHAGLVQSVRGLSGAKLIIHEKQVPYLENLRAFYAKRGGYEPIRVETGDLLSPDRSTLQAIGIQGEIIETPGHSPDSISLLLDTGEAFTGDLTSPELVMDGAENGEEIRASWRRLLDRGARIFYPSHSGPVEAEWVRMLLEEGQG